MAGHQRNEPARQGAGVAEAARLVDLRRALVESLRRGGVITDPRVAEAFDAVPRHHFLPDVPPERVYSDEAIITKQQDGVGISSSSQPAIMAIMLQQLALEPGLRVLEIGAGTGYNAALLRYLVGPTGQVTTIDIDRDIVDGARAHLAAAGYRDVRVLRGDGAYGRAGGAPYDRIVLTVGGADVLPAWVEQLRADGLLVLPLSLNGGQFAVALRKYPNGTLVGESLAECGFMRLRGAFGGLERPVEAVAGEWAVTLEERLGFDPARVLALLERPLGEEPLPHDLDRWGDLLYIRFRGAAFATLYHAPAGGDAEAGQGYLGLLDREATSLCLLGRARDPPRRLAARLYGSRAAYAWLPACLADWAALGRPRLDDLRVLVYPRNLAATPPPGALALTKPHSTVVLARRDGQPLSGPSDE